MKYAVIFIVLSIIIIPLPFSVKGVFSFDNKKTYFNLYFCKVIKFKPAEMMLKMDNSDVLELFGFTKIRDALVLDAADNMAKFIAISLVNQMNFITFSVLTNIKPSIDFKGSTVICDDKKTNGVYFDIGICFSVLKIIAGIIKSFFKGVKNA